jgi:hypothetical protein
MDATTNKLRGAREMFKRSGNHYTMPFADIVNVILAKDAHEGPMATLPKREYDETWAQTLADSVEANGYDDDAWPTFVFHHEKLYAYSGNHRTGALQILARKGFDKMPVVKFNILDLKTMSPEDHWVHLWNANRQKNLGVPDQAVVVAEMMKFSKDKAYVAKRLAITVQTVDNMLEYQNLLPSEIKEMVQKEEVSASTALATFREEGRDGEAAKKRLADAFEAAIAEQAAKVATKKVKKGEEGKKAKVTEKHLKASRTVVSVPDEYASLLPTNGPNVEDLLTHLRDLAEIAQRALKVLQDQASNGNMEADEVAFELEGLLQRGNVKGFTKAAEEISEEAAE